MSYLADQIQTHTKCEGDEVLVVYKTDSHSGYLTYDGVDVNGKRISDEILAEVARLSEGTNKVIKFSIVGYSMGGLVSRYAVGILHHQKFFELVKPVHFVTFCTPHVGTVVTSRKFSARLFNLVAPYVLVHTGHQFWLKDKTPRNHNMPLLVWMADPTLVFYKGLEQFQHLSLYANTINDRRTSWYTTSISNVDPFQSMVDSSLSAYHLQYVPGYEPNVIDFSAPISFKKVEVTKKRFTIRKLAYKSLVWLKVLGGLALFTPIYAIYLLGNSILQRVKLIRRLKSFHKESSNSLTDLYGEGKIGNHKHEASLGSTDQEPYIGTFESSIRNQTDEFVESVFSAVNSESYYDYHDSITKSSQSLAAFQDGVTSKLLNKPDLVNLKGKTVGDFRLPFNKNQEFIVSLLNNLNWSKYPVIIRNTKATHAAVIVRQKDPTFDEGKVIVRHFIEQVFKV